MRAARSGGEPRRDRRRGRGRRRSTADGELIRADGAEPAAERGAGDGRPRAASRSRIDASTGTRASSRSATPARASRAEIREQVFEPFFTTKARGGGLGLPIARRTAELHGGIADADVPARGRDRRDADAACARPPVPRLHAACRPRLLSPNFSIRYRTWSRLMPSSWPACVWLPRARSSACTSSCRSTSSRLTPSGGSRNVAVGRPR